MLRFSFIIVAACSILGTWAQDCTPVRPCRFYQLQATANVVTNFGTMRYVDAYLSYAGSPNGTVSLDSQSLVIEVPRFLNVTNLPAGNSGDALSYLTFDLVHPQTGVVNQVVCKYQGIGIAKPFLDSEIAAANAYAFQSCNDIPSTTGYQQITAGSVISTNSLIMRCQGGGNTAASSQTVIGLNISEVQQAPVQNTYACSPIPPDSVGQLGGNGISYAKVYGGIWNSPPQCIPISATIPTGTMMPTTAAPSSTVNSDLPFSTQPPTSSQPGSSDNLNSNSNSNGLNSMIVIILICVSGVIALLSIILIIGCYRRQKRLSMFLTTDQGDLEHGSRKKLHKKNLHASSKTVGASADSIEQSADQLHSVEASQDFDEIYGEEVDRFEQQQQQFGATGRMMMNPADCTMINTKTAIALPGFLKIDYNADVRPYKVIAEGGGGVIYEAELLDDRLRTKYRTKHAVVKLVKNPGTWTQEELVLNFKTEVAIMWSLNFHENIIKLIGFTDEPLSIVMKYYARSLSDVIKNAALHYALTPEVVFRMTYHVSDALCEMHSIGIVHRDIKPNNILIDAPREIGDPNYWRAVICDFGLAKIIGESDIKGAKFADVQGISIRYAAPEVFKRLYLKGNTVTSASKDQSAMSMTNPEEEKMADVYAFAIVIWEMMAKKSCWDRMHSDEIECAVREGQRPEFDQDTLAQIRSSDLLKSLNEIMMICWSGNPMERMSFEKIKQKLKAQYSELPQYDWTQLTKLSAHLRQSTKNTSSRDPPVADQKQRPASTVPTSKGNQRFRMKTVDVLTDKEKKAMHRKTIQVPSAPGLSSVEEIDQ
ncbi:hypothetical protein MIR68_009483 [Amoeboaphelidium protococcarum]|nr:hypothetical protein MIR68_009483 [Amoeboaphelidium protococcarum]